MKLHTRQTTGSNSRRAKAPAVRSLLAVGLGLMLSTAIHSPADAKVITGRGRCEGKDTPGCVYVRVGTDSDIAWAYSFQYDRDGGINYKVDVTYASLRQKMSNGTYKNRQTSDDVGWVDTKDWAVSATYPCPDGRVMDAKVLRNWKTSTTNGSDWVFSFDARC